ncbi:MAG: flagellar assembly peptidoglycan hydrolase FlgJ [Sedimenticola sp.]|nr:flagellar assembly peptidoglycan hydrolase FlgJ [Sedimenticola sp.]
MNQLANASIYTDMQGLTALKARAVEDAEGSLDAVARQFESLFVQQMLKSMRQAGLGEGLMDSEQSLFYRDMYDQQLSLHLAEHGGIGLAEVIKRQMGDGESTVDVEGKGIEAYRQMAIRLQQSLTGRPQETSVPDVVTTDSETAAVANSLDSTEDWSTERFVEELWPWAVEAAGMLGLKPQALLAQAALETGWGRHQIRGADGAPANNLFGIKADRRWEGDRVSVSTLEYEQGTAVKKRAYFRSYETPRDSFHDYVGFLQANPRYQKALQSTADSSAYFQALQQAGYATDPEYASKINAVMNGPEMSRALERLKSEELRPL